jgi:hypothetical protein
VVVLAFAIGGGILGYQCWLTKEEVKTPEVKGPEEGTLWPEEKLSENEVADWEIYRNKLLGFEIKYPASLFKIISKNGAIVFYHSFPFKYFTERGELLTELWDTTISFSVERTNFNSAIKNRFSLYPEGEYGGGPITIANRQAWWGTMGAEGITTYYYFIKISETETFIIKRDSIWEAYDQRLSQERDFVPGNKQRAVFELMLSTFKFID